MSDREELSPHPSPIRRSESAAATDVLRAEGNLRVDVEDFANKSNEALFDELSGDDIENSDGAGDECESEESKSEEEMDNLVGFGAGRLMFS